MFEWLFGKKQPVKKSPVRKITIPDRSVDVDVDDNMLPFTAMASEFSGSDDGSGDCGDGGCDGD